MSSTKSSPDILSFLKARGVEVIQEGSRWICNSPITRLRGGEDKTPSFVIFSDGAFKDYSSGEYGDVFELARILGDSSDLSKLPKFVPTKSRKQSHWNNIIPDLYLDIDDSERSQILDYGRSRRITEGFIPGCYYTPPDYTKHLALMFVHKDLHGNICGAKFRAIQPATRRFVIRGRSGFYTLKTGTPLVLFLVESETSANSMWMICKERGINAVILSHGSVQNIPQILPYPELSERRLCIDFDGNEELYQTRLEKYRHLNLKPLKLVLPKGSDINSIYCDDSYRQWWF